MRGVVVVLVVVVVVDVVVVVVGDMLWLSWLWCAEVSLCIGTDAERDAWAWLVVHKPPANT